MTELPVSFTVILIILTALISIPAFNNPAMRDRLIFHPYTIARQGEYYRFLTHGFLHANWTHLLINMYVLYIFGEFLEDAFRQIFPNSLGTVMFLLLYLSAIVLSSVPSFIKHKDDPGYRALGASGATSALIFSFILFNPWEWFLFPPLPAVVFGLAFLWYSNYMARRQLDNIGHDAHFWGAVFGLLFTLVSIYYLQPVMLDFFLQQLLQGPSIPNF